MEDRCRGFNPDCCVHAAILCLVRPCVHSLFADAAVVEDPCALVFGFGA